MRKILFSFLILSLSISAFAINIPTQSSPANSATDQATGVTLWINTVSGATEYDYMLDTVNTFDSPALRLKTHTSSYSGWTPYDLYYGQTYYWKIRARNATETSDWSSVFMFTTNLLGVTQSNPADGATNTGTELSLYVNVLAGTENVDYQLDVVSTFDSPGLREYTHTGSYSGKTVSDLDYGQTYYWRARGRNDSDTSVWTSIRSFTTNTSGVTQSTPADGATNTGTSLSLYVNIVSGTGNVDYQLDVVPTFDSPELTEYTHTNSYSGKTVYGLDYGRTYYWRVRGRNVNDTSVWTGYRSFTTNGLGATQSTPADGATNTGTGLTLYVNIVSGTDNVDYQLDTSANFNSAELREYTHNNSYSGQNISGLDYGQTYYWRIRGRNVNDTSVWTGYRSFTTNGFGATQSSPSDGATNTGTSPTLYVNIVSGTDNVDYQLDTSSNFNSPELQEYTHNNSYSGKNIYGLDYGQTYYWRVRGRNANDTSVWTAYRSFTTNGLGVTQSSPSDGAVNTGTSLTMYVNLVSGTENVDYQLDTSAGFNSPGLLEYTHTSSYSGKTVSDLFYGQTYYWRVRGRNANDTSAWTSARSFTTNAYGANQTSPSSGATGRPVNLTLYLSLITGSENADYQLDTTAGFNSPLLTEKTHSNSYSSQSFTGLRYGQEYFWRVRGRNDNDTSLWSSVWTFTTGYELVNAPVLTAPHNDSINVPYVSFNIIWNTLADVTNYQYQISTNSGFTGIIRSGNTSLTFRNITALTPATTYYWRVRGENVNGYSPWSEVWTFTTESAELTAPVQVSPSDGAVSQPVDIVLNWNEVFGANTYTVMIAGDAGFTLGSSSFVTSDTEYAVNGLSENFTYYWKVQAGDGTVQSPWSEVWSFTTQGAELTAPIQVSPSDGAVSQPVDIVLDWNEVSGANTYTVMIAGDSDFTAGVNSFATSDTEYAVNGLSENFTYYWKVQASDGNIESPWSEVWSFTTINTTPHLDAPVLISPADGATGVNFVSTGFEWSAVDGADTYTIQVSENNAFSVIFSEQVTTSTTINISDLNCNTQYFWRVKAVNTLTESEWSDVFDFITDVCSDISVFTENKSEIYPNPASDVIYIGSGSGSDDIIEIYDAGSKMVFSGTLRKQAIDISKLNPGLYFVSFTNENGQKQIRKFVKE